MKLKQSSNKLIKLDNYKNLKIEDYHHGYHRQSKDVLAEKYFYLVDPDYGWKYEYLSDNDRELFDNNEKDKIDWSKYNKEHSKMNADFSAKWKEFYSKHNDIISKYETGGCAIMMISHFVEGRSNGYFIIKSFEEFKRLKNDMISIGIDVSDFK